MRLDEPHHENHTLDGRELNVKQLADDEFALLPRRLRFHLAQWVMSVGRLLASRGGGGWNEQTRQAEILETKAAQDKTRPSRSGSQQIGTQSVTNSNRRKGCKSAALSAPAIGASTPSGLAAGSIARDYSTESE